MSTFYRALAILAVVAVAGCAEVQSGADKSREVTDEIDSSVYHLTFDYSDLGAGDWAGVWRTINRRAQEECIPGVIESIRVDFENMDDDVLPSEPRTYRLDCDDL